MRRFDYERLHRDRLEARHARLMAERRRYEIVRERAILAGLRLDLAFLKLERILRRKYRPDQPRVPAGNPDGGR